ncbi:hypothetical protein THIX_70209 [Thiomonas sp. X19]|nr:hypothetical protein THIX_70209 [Thiomonas sp. X19]
MSIAAMEAVASLQVKASPRLVMFALAWNTREKAASTCCASLAKLAQHAGLSEVQTRRILKQLEHGGLIRRAEWGGRAVTWELTCLAQATSPDERPDLSPHERARNERAGLSLGERAALSPDETHEKEKENSLRSAQRARGGRGLQPDQNGILHRPGDPRDQAALTRIREYPEPTVLDAVRSAQAHERQGRAFPSAVLRILNGKSNSSNSSSAQENAPAWAKFAPANRNIFFSNSSHSEESK